MKARILNVQRFCTKDGPGIRTTVFFKGCPLSCLWCHNPESQSGKAELLFNAEKCVHCMRCVAHCPQNCHQFKNGSHAFDRTSCIACGACLSPLCDALELAGEEKTVDDILEEVLLDELYYQNSEGGITLSGGEPLMQSQAALELLQKAKARGIHTCLETCGFVSRDVLEKTLPLVDLYLYDFKETDPKRHMEWTGVDNRVILENLKFLDSMGKATILRCPIIPTLNDRDEHLRGIATLANSMQNVREIVIEPYHTLGVGKYARLGKAYSLSQIDTLDGDAAECFISKLKALTHLPVEKA